MSIETNEDFEGLKEAGRIGRTVEGEIKKCGFSVIRELCGHGIGRTIHEEPEVPNQYDFRASQRLTKGLVITIEPMASIGSGEAVEAEDGWTVASGQKFCCTL